MKNHTKIFSFFAASMLLISTSCDKRMDEMNVSPNNPENVPSQMLLTSAMLSTVYNVQLRAGTSITDLWVQHVKATTYTEEDTYNARNDRMDRVWSGLYSESFQDCIEAIRIADENGQPNNKAIGLVLKGYIGYNLTTLFGDVPYSEAGKGKSGVTSPTYDPQQDVLNAIVSDMDEAIAMMDNSGDREKIDQLSTYDVIYHGDMDKWKKFANGIKIRCYLTLTSGGVNKLGEIRSLLSSSDVFTSHGDDAQLSFSESPSTNSNPVYQWINEYSARVDDYRISESIVNYMMGSSVDAKSPVDARLTVYADTTESGEYVGGRNGKTGGISSNSKLGTSFYTAEKAFTLMGYTELMFIKAEVDPSQANYESAVKASFSEVGMGNSSANAMLQDVLFAYSTASGARLIAEQKWVALYGQGVEAFNSWRRSGYPLLTPAANAATANGFIPRRLSYNTDEKNLNVDNVNAGISGLNGDDLISSQMWFDRGHAASSGNKL